MKAKIILLAFAVLGFVASAEAQKDPLVEGAKKEGKVVFYSSEDRKPLEGANKAFTAKYGIPVELNRQATGRSLRLAQSEFETNTVKADVLDITNPLVFFEWKQKGYLQPWKAAHAEEQVSNLFRDKEGFVWARRLLVMCIGYNKKQVSDKDAPKTWQDVLQPKWKDKIVMSGTASGPSFGWIVYIVNKYGWKYFDSLHANNPIVAPSGDEAFALLATGEKPIIIGNPCFDMLEAAAQGSPIGNVYPEDGPGIWWAGLGITKAAPHPNAAQLFANFLMSKDGSAAAANARNGFVAYLNKDTPLAKEIPPMQNLVKGYPKIDWDTVKAGQIDKEFRKRMGQQ
jgi:iron(III) transport system substrate-binding protein